MNVFAVPLPLTGKNKTSINQIVLLEMSISGDWIWVLVIATDRDNSLAHVGVVVACSTRLKWLKRFCRSQIMLKCTSMECVCYTN